MYYRLKTFNVGSGDCITLLLRNGNEEIQILVDCGCATPEVEDYIDKTFHRHIDYLIITHIDNDYIKGLISLLFPHARVSLRGTLYLACDYQRIEY